MQKNKRIRQVINLNLDIVEVFFKDVQAIINSDMNRRIQIKRLHSARYNAVYLMQINNAIIDADLQEKPRSKNG